MNSTRRVSLCLTGSELTRGETHDTNGPFLAVRLARSGFDVVEIRLMPDGHAALVRCFRELGERSDVVFLSGGLGPTADDLTVAALAEATGQQVTRDEKAQRHMLAIALRRGRKREDIPDNFWKQAEVVSGSTVLQNPVGLAPAGVLEFEGTLFITLPGVPRELEAFWPELEKLLIERYQPTQVHFARAKVFGVPESHAEQRIQNLGIDLDAVDYGISAKPGELTLRFAAKDQQLLQQARDRIESEFTREILWLRPEVTDPSSELDALVARLQEVLEAKQETLSTAESCTGGMIAKVLTDRAGSSATFRGSVVAYENEVKTALLGVPTELLQEHGAVSEEVARAMALGAIERLDTDWSLSTTGIAGPGGGSSEKPVGLVFMAVAHRSGRVVVEGREFLGTREMIRRQATVRTLDSLRRALA